MCMHCVCTTNNYSDYQKILYPEGCNGCIHRGKWDDELEYGYSCPCLMCSRRCHDNYKGEDK